jgi:hypothetical protein
VPVLHRESELVRRLALLVQRGRRVRDTRILGRARREPERRQRLVHSGRQLRRATELWRRRRRRGDQRRRERQSRQQRVLLPGRQRRLGRALRASRAPHVCVVARRPDRQRRRRVRGRRRRHERDRGGNDARCSVRRERVSGGEGHRPELDGVRHPRRRRHERERHAGRVGPGDGKASVVLAISSSPSATGSSD